MLAYVLAISIGSGVALGEQQQSCSPLSFEVAIAKPSDKRQAVSKDSVNRVDAGARKAQGLPVVHVLVLARVD